MAEITKEIKQALKHHHDISTFCLRNLIYALECQQTFLDPAFHPAHPPKPKPIVHAAYNRATLLLQMTDEMHGLLLDQLKDYLAIRPLNPKPLTAPVPQP